VLLQTWRPGGDRSPNLSTSTHIYANNSFDRKWSEKHDEEDAMSN
jgi:hypothetical protein